MVTVLCGKLVIALAAP
ncbi:hypothetical protein NB560_18825 [Vibrio cholerae]|nr:MULTISPECIES: hypothetical protein [Vibrio]MCR9797191.1 hypothetical protein [Vibrio cholerae]MDS1829101.1 hypothetical protein [Vibrio vulnificus]